MKQTLKEASQKGAEGYNIVGQTIYKSGFRAGAEWHAKQSPWISVEERLPEEGQEVLVLRTYISAKSRERRYKIFIHTFFKTYGFKICETRKYIKEKVIGWMPIPSFDEILEVNRDVLERIKEKGD